MERVSRNGSPLMCLVALKDRNATMERVLSEEFAARLAGVPGTIVSPDSRMDPSGRTESYRNYTQLYDGGLKAWQTIPVLAGLRPVITYLFPKGWPSGTAYIIYVPAIGDWVAFVDHSRRHLPVDDEGEVLGGRVLTDIGLTGPSRLTETITAKVRELTDVPGIDVPQ